MEYARFIDLLACPECRQPLREEPAQGASSGTELVCAQCARRYPIAEGVPVLLPPGDGARNLMDTLSSDAGRQMQHEYAGVESASPTGAPGPRPGVQLAPRRRRSRSFKTRLKHWLARLREPVYNTPAMPIARMFQSEGERTRILSVGGGPTRNNNKEINLNIGVFPNVDIVGDAHRLPFATGVLDGAWANAVLEHVADAPRVALEMERVVKPGGYIAVLQPFLQAYHSYPADYWRFTREGVARLFPACEMVAQGTYVGPTFALLKLGEVYLEHYLPVLFRLRRGAQSRVVKGAVALYTVLFYWLKRLDKKLAPHPSGHLQASVYWIGRKK